MGGGEAGPATGWGGVERRGWAVAEADATGAEKDKDRPDLPPDPSILSAGPLLPKGTFDEPEFDEELEGVSTLGASPGVVWSAAQSRGGGIGVTPWVGEWVGGGVPHTPPPSPSLKKFPALDSPILTNFDPGRLLHEGQLHGLPSSNFGC